MMSFDAYRLVVSATCGTIALVLVAWVAVGWTREKRREVETRARFRRAVAAAEARIDAGMTRTHPENPARPGLLEEIRYGDQYAWFAAQLADIEVSDL